MMLATVSVDARNAVDGKRNAKQTNERTSEKHCNQIEEKRKKLRLSVNLLICTRSRKWERDEATTEHKKFTCKNHCNTNYTIL